MKKINILFLIFQFLIFNFAFCKPGASFLNIGIGARATGIGSAFTAVANDVTAIYWNPAGLSQLTKREISLMHTEWIVDTKLDFVAYAQPIGDSAIGFSAIYLSQNNIEGRNEKREITGNLNVSDLAITVAYSKWLTIKGKQLGSAGINLKFIRQQIETEQAIGIALDLGFLTRISLHPVPYPLTAGFSIQNIGPQMKFIGQPYNLPLTVKAGIGCNIKTLTLSTDIKQRIYERKTSLAFGVEYFPIKLIGLRLGCSLPLVGPDNTIRLSAGLGIKIFSLQTDYSFVPYGNLGNTHRISFSAKF